MYAETPPPGVGGGRVGCEVAEREREGKQKKKWDLVENVLRAKRWSFAGAGRPPPRQRALLDVLGRWEKKAGWLRGWGEGSSSRGCASWLVWHVLGSTHVEVGWAGPAGGTRPRAAPQHQVGTFRRHSTGGGWGSGHPGPQTAPRHAGLVGSAAQAASPSPPRIPRRGVKPSSVLPAHPQLTHIIHVSPKHSPMRARPAPLRGMAGGERGFWCEDSAGDQHPQQNPFHVVVQRQRSSRWPRSAATTRCSGSSARPTRRTSSGRTLRGLCGAAADARPMSEGAAGCFQHRCR